jgi:hypothetical protein
MTTFKSLSMPLAFSAMLLPLGSVRPVLLRNPLKGLVGKSEVKRPKTPMTAGDFLGD